MQGKIILKIFETLYTLTTYLDGGGGVTCVCHTNSNKLDDTEP